MHFILNELVMGGMVLETNMTEILTRIEEQNKLEKEEVRLWGKTPFLLPEIVHTFFFPDRCVWRRKQPPPPQNLTMGVHGTLFYLMRYCDATHAY